MKLVQSLSACLMMLLLSLPTFAGEVHPVRIHDPHIIKCNDAWYIFSTGRGIPIIRSYDLRTWQPVGRVFVEDVPAWAKQKVPAATGIWAPDIFVLNGKYHLYYTVSTFGHNQSCIGLATNATIDPNSPDYRWMDQGLVIETQAADDINAIDAGPFLDRQGEPWMVFGSFWTGIQLIKLDPSTGKTAAGARPVALARRPAVENNPIEAPYVVQRGDYYYLFVSFDFCGRGVNSTYKIMVGRSREVAGPYLDAAGVPMLQGGGTKVMDSHGDIHGPGHNSILVEGDRHYLVNHFYDGRSKGAPTLLISPLTWDANGWPHPADPLPTEFISR